MKFLLTLIALPLTLSATAQHYYKDIVGTRETNEQLRRYRDNRVTAVSVTTFNADGSQNNDLKIVQRLEDGSLTTTTTVGDDQPAYLVAHYDAQGRVVRTVDSSETVISITDYEFGDDGKLLRVFSQSSDAKKEFVQREEHRWEYRNGSVHRMLRIKNATDTLVVSFRLDDAGRVAEERSRKPGLAEEEVYYYYNGQGRLSDVVRYNNRVRRLLPEYMFEYNEGGQLIQRITVPPGNSNYMIWRYQYDNRGLKTREVLYDRYKKLTGKVEYNYTTR